MSGGKGGGSMKTAWQTETGSLECRWAGLPDRKPYNSAWFQQASSEAYESALPPVPDFAAHSPLGSGEWFVPWSARWCVPTR
jgi:hypothetical protein